MNTRSKTTGKPNDKPYKTHTIVTTKQSTKMAEKDPPPAIPQPPENGAPNMEGLTIDQKLNMLIISVAKLETVPNEILTLQNSVKNIQNDVKDIPMIKGKVDVLETNYKVQQQDIEASKITTTALEESLTNTQKDVQDLEAKLKEAQTKMTENKGLIKDLEGKLREGDKKIADLSKKALEDEIATTNYANKIQIEGVPESRDENLMRVVQQILFDTGVKVHTLEIDQIHREGIFNRRRPRPIVVILTRATTRLEILRNRNVIKKNPNCHDIWINEVIPEQTRIHRNELHALYLLAITNGHTSRHFLDTIVVDGISYDHTTIGKLPRDLTLEFAYSREHNDHLYFSSEHMFLSNFHPCEITLEDAKCSSLEQAYFYLMAKAVGDIKTAQLILQTQLPRKIKKIGSGIVATKEWLEKQDQVMYDLLVLKYKQNLHLQAKLLATGNKKLVECTQNKYWGCGLTISMVDNMIAKKIPIRPPGKNWLGTQTEDVRRQLHDISKAAKND